LGASFIPSRLVSGRLDTSRQQPARLKMPLSATAPVRSDAILKRGLARCEREWDYSPPLSDVIAASSSAYQASPL
jgi:hypothetical protein